MKNFILPVFFVLILVSCAKEENINDAPANTIVGNLMSVRMNGATWYATAGKAEHYANGYMKLYAERNPYSDKLTDFTFELDNAPDTGTYKINSANRMVYFDNITDYKADSGTVRITKIVNENDTTFIYGSFNAYTTNIEGRHLIFTEGYFRLPL